MVMASVGNFGMISFMCLGEKKMLSFHDLARSSKANFSEHERNVDKAYLEFGGDGLDELTLEIEADARYGFKPLDVEKQLFMMKSMGQAENFVLGGKQVGDNPFVIIEINETFKSMFADGRPIRIGLQLTLKEYANKTAIIETIPATRQVGDGMAKVSSNDTYTVVKGDCLWNIAKKFYNKGGAYTNIYNANKDIIKNPNLIYPGQVLIIPK